MESFEDWCVEECSENVTNEEFGDIFVIKILRWLKKQKKIDTNNEKELQLKISRTEFRKRILKIMYEMK
tara:strand:- start:150 stop:356 length:207 start_codon:yes stop_codon:yes gene_type:complete